MIGLLLLHGLVHEQAIIAIDAIRYMHTTRCSGDHQHLRIETFGHGTAINLVILRADHMRVHGRLLHVDRARIRSKARLRHQLMHSILRLLKVLLQ